MSSGSVRIAWIFSASWALAACAAGQAPVAQPPIPAQPPIGPAAPAAAPGPADAERALAESRYDQAEAAFRELGSRAGGDAARRGLARVLFATGRAADARRLLEAAVAGAPAPDLDTTTLLAEISMASGQSAA